MADRIWVGPPGAVYIGRDDRGAPVTADEDGAGAMVEITEMFQQLGFQPQPWQARSVGMHVDEDETD